jgi:hypothetical protein
VAHHEGEVAHDPVRFGAGFIAEHERAREVALLTRDRVVAQPVVEFRPPRAEGCDVVFFAKLRQPQVAVWGQARLT